MKKIIWNLLLALPVSLGLAVLAVSTKTLANQESKVETSVSPSADILTSVTDDQAPDQDTSDNDESSLTSISQLSDVQPTDWAFQALQSLVEHYGCISGDDKGKFRGDRPLTRYEFAAALNSCLDQVTKSIASSTSDSATKEDLKTVERLNTEFQPELVELTGKVDQLEKRTAALEAHNFAPTTKLDAIVETVLGSVFAGNNVITKQPAPRITTIGNDISLRLNTSFNGTDQLRIAVGSNTITGLGGPATGTFGTPDGKTSDNASPAYAPNQFFLGGLRYRFVPVKGTAVNIFALSDGALELGLSPIVNPYFEGAGANGISRYSRRNMVFDYGDSGTGVAIVQQLGKRAELGLEYTAINGSTSTPGNGVFNGRYAALGQIVYYGNEKNFRVGLTYVNTFSPSGGNGLSYGTAFGPQIGSNLANAIVPNTATIANVYGLETFYRVNPKLAFNAWVGYAAHRYIGSGDGEVWDWQTGVSFPDLFKKGSLGGISVGMEPKLTWLSPNVNLGAGAGVVDKSTSLHIEAFYQHQVNSYLAITPGVIWITAPNADSSNPDSVVGWIRATFKFQ